MGDVEIEFGKTVGKTLVRSVLQEQHPDLAGLSLVQVAGGWDNRMWRLGEELAVRLPRTMRAASLLRSEQRWLPVLASQLPLPIPTPVRAGEPSGRFPRPWTVTRWIPGEPGDRAPIRDADHAAGRLAGFLRALHREAPGQAPHNPVRGVPLSTLANHFHERLDAVIAHVDVTGVRQVWDQAASTPDWAGPPLWIHADLHPANVVTAGGRLAGIIDFGDLCAGDPATDLAAAWMLLPVGTVPRFLEAYANADHATIQRARGWAVLFALGLIGIGMAWDRGRPRGQPTWGAAGRKALGHVLTSG